MSTTAAGYLETYLHDHRAGAQAIRELAGRLADENLATPYEEFLVGLVREIERDIELLEEIMDLCGVGRPTLKLVAATVAERLGRLKPNRKLAGYSPLSRVLELEVLRAGVEAKLGLWDALMQIARRDDRLDAGELETCRARAEAQLERLREHHATASREAFAAER